MFNMNQPSNLCLDVVLKAFEGRLNYIGKLPSVSSYA